MSKKRTDRPAGTADNSHDDGDDEKQQSSNKNARLDIGHTAASSAAAASSSSSAAAPSVLPARSPAQRLYSDALLSVFRFLSLAEVISAHASCRAWRDAAHKEPSRKIGLLCVPSDLRLFRSLPLRRHVGEYSSDFDCTLSQFASLKAFPFLTSVVIDVCPQSLFPLTSLWGCSGYGTAVAGTVASWPSRLTQLRMQLHKLTKVQAQAMLDCIGQLRKLTSLSLTLGGLLSMGLSLRPLLRLSELRSLHLPRLTSMLASDCGILKQITSLTDIDLTGAQVASPNTFQMPLNALHTLCAPPQQLIGLRQISLGGTTTTAHMDVLFQLPALDALRLHEMEPAAASSLPRLRLRSFALCDGAASLALPSLLQCSELTALTLQLASLTLADLTSLSRSLTGLSILRFGSVYFQDLRRPDALSCLRPLHQLAELHFDCCYGVGLVHLVDASFNSLLSLRRLEVTLPDPEIPAARSLFALPSRIMPQLQHTRIEAFDEDLFEDVE